MIMISVCIEACTGEAAIWGSAEDPFFQSRILLLVYKVLEGEAEGIS